MTFLPRSIIVMSYLLKLLSFQFSLTCTLSHHGHQEISYNIRILLELLWFFSVLFFFSFFWAWTEKTDSLYYLSSLWSCWYGLRMAPLWAVNYWSWALEWVCSEIVGFVFTIHTWPCADKSKVVNTCWETHIQGCLSSQAVPLYIPSYHSLPHWYVLVSCTYPCNAGHVCSNSTIHELGPSSGPDVKYTWHNKVYKLNKKACTCMVSAGQLNI